MHILSPETDNCPSWISGRERMTVENISWTISTKECCRPRRGLNPRPPGLQSDGASNWATEAGFAPKYLEVLKKQCRPWSDYSWRSRLIWVCTVCKCKFARTFGVWNFNTFMLIIYLQVVWNELLGVTRPGSQNWLTDIFSTISYTCWIYSQSPG